VETLILKVKDRLPKTTPADKVVQWADEWLKRIAFLRKCEQRYRLVVETIRPMKPTFFFVKEFLKTNDKFPSNEDRKIYCDCGALLKTLEKIKKELELELHKGFEACKSENVPPEVTACADAKRIVDIIRRDQDRFTLFSDWMGYVGVDEEKIAIKIIDLHKEAERMKALMQKLEDLEASGNICQGELGKRVRHLIDYIKEDDAEMLKRSAEPKHLIRHLQECLGGWIKTDKSTRAIFTIEPELITNDDGSVYFTKNFELRRPHMATLSPDPMTGREARTYLEYFQPGGTVASDTALRLYHITEVAVMELNNSLESYTSLLK